MVIRAAVLQPADIRYCCLSSSLRIWSWEINKLSSSNSVYFRVPRNGSNMSIKHCLSFCPMSDAPRGSRSNVLCSRCLLVKARNVRFWRTWFWENSLLRKEPVVVITIIVFGYMLKYMITCNFAKLIDHQLRN